MSAIRGFTLPELVLALLIAGISVLLTIGPALRQADALALRGAREELIGLFHRARMEARTRGEATLRIAEGEDPLLERPDGRAPVRVRLEERGVAVDILGGRTEIDLRFGPLGTAYFASASLRLSKRDAELPLTISGYGRVRR